MDQYKAGVPLSKGVRRKVERSLQSKGSVIGSRLATGPRRTRRATSPKDHRQQVVPLLLDPIIGCLGSPFLTPESAPACAGPSPLRNGGLLHLRLPRADPVDDDASRAVYKSSFGVKVREKEDLSTRLEVQLGLARDVLQLRGWESAQGVQGVGKKTNPFPHGTLASRPARVVRRVKVVRLAFELFELGLVLLVDGEAERIQVRRLGGSVSELTQDSRKDRRVKEGAP